MNKNGIIPQIYGYAVCLASILVILFQIPQLFEAVTDFADPLHSQRAPRIVNQSFEKWEMDYPNNQFYTPVKPEPQQNVEKKNPPDEKTLRRIFNEEKENEIATLKHTLLISLVTKLLLVLLAIILFFTHWKWLKKLSNSNKKESLQG